MLLLLLSAVFAQAVDSAPPEKIDLTARPTCETDVSQPGEIVVCAQPGSGISPYRLNTPLAEQRQLPKAQMRLGSGSTVSAETERGDVGGFPSNRLMIRFKIEF